MTAGERDLLVVGAGPGGLCAAIEASRAGAAVVVVDDNLNLGGQIYRQLPEDFEYSGPVDHGTEFRRGRELLAEARSLDIELRLETTAWGQFEPGVMEVVSGDRTSRIRARCTVIAPGAYDRPVPVPGWTLPGVFTVGGAQALLKSQRALVGSRVLLAGAGPLLLVVAAQLHEAGAEIVAISEPVSKLAALRQMPAILRERRLALDGIHYRWSLLRGRVPWHSRTRLVRIEGDGHVERAVIAPAAADWSVLPGRRRSFEVDAVCIGYGLLPSLELPRICGCECTYDDAARAWVPVRDQEMQSTVPGVYLVGDGAGVAGAVVATAEGRIAGLAVARDLGHLSPERANPRIGKFRSRLEELERFRRAMDAIYGPRAGLYDLDEPSTTICRCEEVTLRELDEAYEEGADSFDVLKGWTRAGMGSCQGRMCGPFVREWLARRRDVPLEAVSSESARPPARPVVTLGALAAASDRNDTNGPAGERA